MQLSGYQHNKNSKYFRLAQLLLALLGIWVLSQWWWNSNQQGELLFQQQSAELMRSTLVALSHTAAYLIRQRPVGKLKPAHHPYCRHPLFAGCRSVRCQRREVICLRRHSRSSVVIRPSTRTSFACHGAGNYAGTTE